MMFAFSLPFALGCRPRRALARLAWGLSGTLCGALWLALAVLTPAAAAAQSPTAAVVTTPQVRAELMAHAPEGLAPGRPVWVGLQIAHQPDWHTYWKNAGDSGLPTQLQWQLPAGVSAGDIQWPLPKKIPIGTLANYGYEHTVLLPVPLTIGPDFKPPLLGSTVPIQLKANWLVCRKECIPEEGEFTLSLPVKGSTALHAAAFEAAQAAQPQALAGTSTVTLAGDRLSVRVSGLPAAARGQALGLFPETADVIETAGAWTQAWQGDTWTASVPLSPQRSQSPATMPLVLTLDGATPRRGWRAEATVVGTWPTLSAAKPVSQALDDALRANAAASAPNAAPALGLWAALVGALLGGLILNLMPCVFPVLAIKLLGFAQHGSDRRAHRANGLAYTAGVVLSFLSLGGLMLALRAAGEQLGWGFQLQSPGVVAGLAVLFTLIGLNLAGLFEFGQWLPSRLATLEAQHPAANAGLSGVLAVAVASPCTAPFMGASLGFAVGLPALQALAVFAALGLGMALPYLAASLSPAVVRWLPRPGAWMATFRQAMAFPMFATVVWLVWVLGQQSGIDGAAALLVLLVLLGMAVWAGGLGGRARTVLATISIALLIIFTWAVGPKVIELSHANGTEAVGASFSADGAATDPTAAVASTAGRWQTWQPGRVEQLLASGRPVFVDFTAAWCVTCQYNKTTTLANGEVLADFHAKQVTLLRADWTRRDPAITAALTALGRTGVPVYVFYAPGQAPVVLSEILSVDQVRAALARLRT